MVSTVKAVGDHLKPLRADALRNAEKISVAAADAFAEHGLEVSIADVASRAGVGVGTVYRRFGDKDGLIEAVFISQVHDLIDAATEAHSDDGVPDLGERFAEFCLYLCATLANNKGLREVALGATYGRIPTETNVAAINQLIPHLDILVARAQRSGWLRSDFAATDLLLVVSAVGAIRDLGATTHPDVWRRVLRMAIDGIRTDSRIPWSCDVPPPLADAEVREVTGAPPIMPATADD